MATATCPDCWDDYCCPRHTVRIHVYKEGDYWMVDGVALPVTPKQRRSRNMSLAVGGVVPMTEACWSYDTFDDAVAAIPAFAREHATNLIGATS